VLDRAQGVELLGSLDGSGYRSGAALVRRADGQMVQLGPLMYALLDTVDGRRDTLELSEALRERLGRACDEEHVVRLAEKLAAQGLLAGSEHNAPPRRNPLLALRFKLLVTNPRVTRWASAPFTFLFRPGIVSMVVATFAAVLWFVLFRKGLASATAEAFDRPGLLLLVFALAVASAAFHELGHAAACRYGGATPGGMGVGIYIVWPAFYTDVTDAYRLSRRARLRVDLGGIYFNALVAVVTLGAWLLLRVDALLLLVGLQLLIMVKNLSPVIRSDGYHILADATGVPDLYAHIGPTLRGLVPWRRKHPSALTGKARVFVTIWVLVVVPVLLALMVGAVLLLPRMLTTAWDSGLRIAATMPREGTEGVAADALRLVALTLPVLGSMIVAQRLLRMATDRARAWSAGRPVRRSALVAFASLAAVGAAWAWWPSGQYEAIRPTDHATLPGLTQVITRPQHVARPRPVLTSFRLRPGPHLAIAAIPVGGATPSHPAFFLVPGKNGEPAVALVSTSSPDPATTSAPGPAATTTTTAAAATTTAAQPTPPAPQQVQAAAFPFRLPDPPRPGDSQALAVNTTDRGVTYDIAYSLVTVSGGSAVTNTNSAYAYASCKACTTVAVSFQVVLVVGQSRTIAPINIAAALNSNCPACLTTAVADQIVVTLKSKPTPELVDRIQTALQRLDAIRSLGADAAPAAIASQVDAVQQQVDDVLTSSGQLASPPPTTTAATAAATTTVPTSLSTSTTMSTTQQAVTIPSTTSSSTTTAPSATTTEPTTTAPATSTETGTTTTTPSTSSTTTAPATTTTTAG
jgi:putative peptide zinc metalloprotease protein